MYLLKVFDEPEMYRKLEPQAVKFEKVHNTFCDLMKTIVADPKVLSILGKQGNEKGYRTHQGDKLRDMVLNLIQEEVFWRFIDPKIINLIY